MIEVKLPKIREDVNESLVVIWFVSEGDAVKKGDPLLEIQTEKEVSEVEAEASGTVNEIIYKRGESAKVGEVLATINPAENAHETKPEEQKIVENTEPETQIPDDGQKPEEQKITEDTEQPKEASGQTGPAKTLRLAPGLRKLARELNVPLESIAGTGRNGKITEKDIRRVAGQTAAAEPAAKAEELQQEESAPEESTTDQAIDEAQTKEAPEKETTQKNTENEELPSEQPQEDLGQQEQASLAEQAEAILEPDENDRESDAVPFSGIRGVIAKRMTESLQNSAQLTETAWADVTKLHSKKDALGKEVGWTAVVAKAAAQALGNHPLVNAHIKEGQILPQEAINLGFAIDTDRGLQVAVLQEADKHSLGDLQKHLADLAEKARNGQLPNEQSSGSTFTITTLGAYRIQFFTPIINPPETAILGIGTIETYLALEGGKVQERKRLPLSLTIDHRAIDGAPAAKFLGDLIGLLEKPKQLFKDDEVMEKEKKKAEKKKEKKKDKKKSKKKKS
ncbi:dihydrolipoamide acetyltransferase family protein [Planococcus sp. N064]|uniref:Dihydrolipoamide acetyltransferase component of pyruvate dehydrogenase complex n=1 Tax=Planococcus liqunii TaxID=3058394 RepID=A0ABT8MS00_9BACL|nr:dihydrolipoamide acetyltransferase family protein [Planococcus sp. N064]MDN7227530.1 dihydrolipoamide acetyltransferase family protein [Planococcus sp. N064]